MAEVWMSVAEAAAAMKVHPRTVERRIAANKIESRRSEEGQVQILVNMPNTPPVVAQNNNNNHALETVRDLADRQVDIAAGSASALIRVAQEQTIQVENQLMIARQDASRFRKEAQMSLALVACMLIAVIGAVGWCAHAITASQAEARLSADRAEKSAEQSRLAQADRDRNIRSARAETEVERSKFDEAIVARAKAEGELNAYKTELATVIDQTKRPAPTTRPTDLVSRLQAAFIGD